MQDEQKPVKQDVYADLLKKVEEQQKQIDLLTKSTSKARLAQNTEKEEIGMSCRVSLFKKELSDNPKLVIGWQLLRDLVRTDRNGIEEDQVVEITTEDKSIHELRLTEFHDLLEKVEVPVNLEKTTFEKDGSLKDVWIILNDKEYCLKPQFIN